MNLNKNLIIDILLNKKNKLNILLIKIIKFKIREIILIFNIIRFKNLFLIKFIYNKINYYLNSKY